MSESSPAVGSHLGLRWLAGLLALPATFYALVGASGLLRARSFDAIGSIFTVEAATFAALLGWFALRGADPPERTRMRNAMLVGVVVGGIAFAVGFFGPLVWAPDANQGPLLGIFVTGPLGFTAGVVGGWLFTAIRSR